MTKIKEIGVGDSLFTLSRKDGHTRLTIAVGSGTTRSTLFLGSTRTNEELGNLFIEFGQALVVEHRRFRMTASAIMHRVYSALETALNRDCTFTTEQKAHFKALVQEDNLVLAEEAMLDAMLPHLMTWETALAKRVIARLFFEVAEWRTHTQDWRDHA